ncbi:MAG: GHKL domain-containing protein, partial [Lachnospiraceae bacterium]|nr:GHKL domain-containing protein [Lachnospiraceae bacterium]
SMIFKVGDMSGLRLDGEETVILLSNLLDNAIHECVKVVRAGQKAVIHIKLVQEDGKLIFSVKNPVAENVQVTEGIVLDSNGEMHSVGLTNVKEVVDKYGGDFAISCDSEKFQAVVML